MFGFIVLVILLVPMYYIPASPPFSGLEGHLEDPFDAFAQLSQNWQIVFATFGTLKLTVCIYFSKNSTRYVQSYYE